MANDWSVVSQEPAPANWNVVSQDPASTNVGQVVHQGLSGVDEGIANTLGFPVDMANAGIGLAESGINAVAGTNLQPASTPLFGSSSIKKMMGPTIAPPTANGMDQFVRRTGQSVGASIIPGMGVAASAARPAAALFSSLGSGLTGGVAGATAQKVAPGNPYVEMGAELAGGMSPFMAANALKKGASALTVNQVKSAAGDQYDLAEKMGVTATQPQTQQLADKLHDIATEEGLISPTGRVSTAYPKAQEALLMANDYSNGTMTVPQMGAFRKTLSDAADSQDGTEQRIALRMLHAFDDFTAPLAPPLATARDLYSQAMKGKTLDTLNELAESNAKRMGTGLDKPLKTEYGKLERNIIKGNEPGFTPVEQASVSKVAGGSKPQRLFSAVGSGAPKGPVSFGMTVGLPFLMGTAAAGPGGGAALSTLAAAATYAARGVASKLGEKAANDALQLILRGGPQVASSMSLTDTQRLAVSSLLSEMSANQMANAQTPTQ